MEQQILIIDPLGPVPLLPLISRQNTLILQHRLSSGNDTSGIDCLLGKMLKGGQWSYTWHGSNNKLKIFPSPLSPTYSLVCFSLSSIHPSHSTALLALSLILIWILGSKLSWTQCSMALLATGTTSQGPHIQPAVPQWLIWCRDVHFDLEM